MPADWNVTPYHGQNDNMHACEAMDAAYEATGQDGLPRSRLRAG
jgi:mannose/cellobiose epimerase-like protein (N-acyl-D-glucosamine 2-epimerase family)